MTPAALANPFTGPLLGLGAAPRRPHDPEVACWNGELAPLTTGGPARAVSGGGWTDAAAQGACIGEALERFDPRPQGTDGVHRASFRGWDGPAPAVSPEVFVGFHPEQFQPGFPYRHLDEDTDLDWVAFRDAATGAARWVPAALAYLEAATPGGHPFGPVISTGMVAGPRRAPLVLRGLQEVLERDAVVGAWWGRYPLVRLPADQVLAALGSEKARRLTRPNLTWKFYRVESPLTRQVTLATLAGEDREGFCFSVGSACRETRGASLEKSALEAVQGRYYARYLRRDRPAPRGPVTDFPGHAAYYSHHPERLAETCLARATPEDLTAGPIESLAALRANLGPERPVLFRDMTPPSLGEWLPDLAVLRVMVPGTQPLWCDDRFPPLGGPLWGDRPVADFAALPPHPMP